jgi:hypothetical protein
MHEGGNSIKESEKYFPAYPISLWKVILIRIMLAIISVKIRSMNVKFNFLS